MTNSLQVTEGVSGLWHYHLSLPTSKTRGLCGALVMGTSIPRDDWRKPFGDHFPKRPTWCEKCDARANETAHPVKGEGHEQTRP